MLLYTHIMYMYMYIIIIEISLQYTGASCQGIGGRGGAGDNDSCLLY